MGSSPAYQNVCQFPRGFEQDVTRRSDHLFALVKHPETTFEDDAVLVLAAVPVHLSPDSRPRSEGRYPLDRR
jgi:hypothetical protein